MDTLPDPAQLLFEQLETGGLLLRDIDELGVGKEELRERNSKLARYSEKDRAHTIHSGSDRDQAMDLVFGDSERDMYVYAYHYTALFQHVDDVDRDLHDWIRFSPDNDAERIREVYRHPIEKAYPYYFKIQNDHERRSAAIELGRALADLGGRGDAVKELLEKYENRVMEEFSEFHAAGPVLSEDSTLINSALKHKHSEMRMEELIDKYRLHWVFVIMLLIFGYLCSR